jgi:hypothetical protein
MREERKNMKAKRERKRERKEKESRERSNKPGMIRRESRAVPQRHAHRCARLEDMSALGIPTATV